MRPSTQESRTELVFNHSKFSVKFAGANFNPFTDGVMRKVGANETMAILEVKKELGKREQHLFKCRKLLDPRSFQAI